MEPVPEGYVEDGFVIALLGIASTGEALPQPCYLRDGDADFVGPNPEITGVVYHTSDLARAKRFESWDAAVRFWQTTSTIKPTRPDGKPNKPFTAYSVEFVRVRVLASEAT